MKLQNVLSFTLAWLFSGTVLALGSPVWADIQTFQITAQAWIGDNQSKNDARMLATLEAKRRALEQAGVYVAALTRVQEAQVVTDEILMLTAGVSQTEIISEKPLINEQSFGLEVTAEIRIDQSTLEAHLQKMLHDHEAQQREAELLARNRQLESDLRVYQQQLAQAQSETTAARLRAQQGEKIQQRLKGNDWFERGNQALLAENYALAVTAYTQALSFDPDDAEAYYYRALALIELGDADNARKNFNAAIDVKPQEARYYLQRGKLLFQLNQQDLALADANKSIRLRPQQPEGYALRAQIKQALKQCAQANRDWQIACELGQATACQANCLSIP